MPSQQGEARIRDMKICNENKERGARDFGAEKDGTTQVPEDTRRGTGQSEKMEGEMESTRGERLGYATHLRHTESGSGSSRPSLDARSIKRT
jgi:hypothetical protein